MAWDFWVLDGRMSEGGESWWCREEKGGGGWELAYGPTAVSV